MHRLLAGEEEKHKGGGEEGISLEGEEKDKGEEGRGLLASGVRAIKV